MDGSDCCLICTGELNFCGVGPCGHKEVCGRCVARLRFVLQDKRCPLCQQDCQQVFFTRSMGDYTARIAAEEYPRLKSKADRGELFRCPEVEGYFDDQTHFNEIKSLCGYTHPSIDALAVEGRLPPTFKSLALMRQFIEKNGKNSFCDVCLTGRQVFLSEQILYSKADLEKHHRTGDAEGPMSGEHGFRGHPSCKFCKKRFYDSSELFRHMESAHEQCFICRRSAPDKYVYYRHYQELEEHFRKDHHMCPHPECLAKKFVVFPNEPDFKRHLATEHGDDMSRAQKKEMLSIPIQLNYRDHREAASGSTLSEADMRLVQMMQERSGVTIGGGHGVAARIAPRAQRGGIGASGSSGAVGGGMRHCASETHVAQAEEDIMSVTFSAEDFPTVASAHGGAGGSGMAPVGLWSGPAGNSGRGLHNSNFPALPNKAKGKTGAGSQHATMAEKMAAARRPIRVLNSARGGAGTGTNLDPARSNTAAMSAGPGSYSDYPSLSGANDFELPAAYQQPAASSGYQPYRPMASAGYQAGASGSSAPSSGVSTPPAASGTIAAPAVVPTLADAFPALPSSSAPKAQAHAVGSSSRAAAAYHVATAAPFQPSMTAASVAAPLSAPQAVPMLNDFPSLMGSPAKPGKGSKANKGSGGSGGNGSSSSSINNGTSSSVRPTSAPPAPAADLSSPALLSVYAAAFKRASNKGVLADTAEKPMAGPAANLPRPDDFPSLGQVAVALAVASKAAIPTASAAATSVYSKTAPHYAKAKSKSSSNSSQPTAASAAAVPAPTPSPVPTVTALVASTVSSTPQGGVSETLKAANRAVIEKIKRQLTDEQFTAFKQHSGEFMQGKIPAHEYHEDMVNLGLLSLTAELASLCPIAERRKELIDAHKSFLQSPAAHDASRGGRGWVPPEAAIAAAKTAEEQSSWPCATCSLMNAPHLMTCEACHTTRAGRRPRADDFPSLGGAGSASGSTPQHRPATADAGGKPKGKAKAVKVFSMPGPGTGRVLRQEWPGAGAPKGWGQDER